MAVPSSALRIASSGDNGGGFRAIRGGSAFGKISQLVQAMKIAKQALLANATARCSAIGRDCIATTGMTETKTRMNSGASFGAPLASAYSAWNTMTVLKPNRRCGAPRNAYDNNNPKNAEAPITRLKPSAT